MFENIYGELIAISALIEVQQKQRLSIEPVYNVQTKSTSATVLVDSRNFAFNIGSVSLYVDYTTSGYNNTGRITSHEAYTLVSGITLNYEWIERRCSSSIVGTKDIYASARGELVSIFWTPLGEIETGRTEVFLSGVFAIR